MDPIYGPRRGSKQAWNDTYVKKYISEFNMEQSSVRFSPKTKHFVVSALSSEKVD